MEEFEQVLNKFSFGGDEELHKLTSIIEELAKESAIYSQFVATIEKQVSVKLNAIVTANIAGIATGIFLERYRKEKQKEINECQNKMIN